MGAPLAHYEKAGELIRWWAWILIASCVALVAVDLRVVIEHGAIESGAFLPLVIFGLPMFLLALAHLAIARAIREHKRWGRVAGIIVAIIFIPGFPIGTIVGLYILWCLVNYWDREPD
jgi:hypothetical protein